MSFLGFGFSGYRSVGDELVKIAPLGKINFIIGQNNVGKSNIIDFLGSHYAFMYERVSDPHLINPVKSKISFGEVDHHQSDKAASHRIAFPLVSDKLDEYLETKIKNGHQNGSVREYEIEKSPKDKKYTHINFREIQAVRQTLGCF